MRLRHSRCMPGMVLAFWFLPAGAGDVQHMDTGLSQAEPILPLPLTVELDRDTVALGERLFNDPRLARNNALACAVCHQVEAGGDDGLARSLTNAGEPDVIHTPTVLNAAFNFRQTWRGEFRTLEQQAEADLHNPRHANMTWEELIPRLGSIPEYKSAFSAIYPDGIQPANVTHAIATYERSLITPNARFDRYLRGETRAITEEERDGYLLFKGHGCAACHQGVNVGGNLYQKIGQYADYFRDRPVTKADLGRYNVTGREEDRHVFKVPSLRNVAITAPYFHDGSQATLDDAIKAMAYYQLGVIMDDDEIALIAKFLGSLTGELNGKSLEPPADGVSP